LRGNQFAFFGPELLGDGRVAYGADPQVSSASISAGLSACFRASRLFLLKAAQGTCL